MIDIVERLRDELACDTASLSELTLEAADEIERLRERLEINYGWSIIDGKKTKVPVTTTGWLNS